MGELYHFGIPGMKWGQRRYQNYDGSLTSAGKARYGIGDRIKQYRANQKRKQALKKARQTRELKKARAEGMRSEQWKDYSNDDLKKYNERAELEKRATEYRLEKINRAKKYADTVLGYASTGINAYDTYKKLVAAVDEMDSNGKAKESASTKAAKNFLKKYEDDNAFDITKAVGQVSTLQQLEKAAKGEVLGKKKG